MYIVTASSPPLLILEYGTYRQIEIMGISLRNVEPKVDGIKEDDLKVEMTTFSKYDEYFRKLLTTVLKSRYLNGFLLKIKFSNPVKYVTLA